MNKFISASKIERMRVCPASAFLPRLETSNERTEYGEYVHSAIAKLFLGDEMTADERALVEEIFTESFMDKLVKLKDEKEMLIEHSFSLDTGHKGYIVNGIMDMLILGEQEAIVRDWKTGMTAYGQEDVINSAQGKVYSYAVFKTRQNISTVIFELAMTHTYPRRAVRVIYTRDDVPALEKWLHNMIDKYDRYQRDGGYPSIPGTHCYYCTHIYRCAKERKVFDIVDNVIIEDDEQLNERLNQLTIAKAAVKLLEEHTMEYMRANPDASPKDWVIEREAVERVDMSRKKVAQEWFREKFPDIMKPDTALIKEALLANAELYDEAKRLGYVTDKSEMKIKCQRRASD